MKIQDTREFQQMDYIAQKIALKQRKKITDSVAMLKTVGIEKWETLNKDLPNRLKNIVKELAADAGRK